MKLSSIYQIDAEKALIGAILHDPSVLLEIEGHVETKHFHPNHRRLVEALPDHTDLTVLAQKGKVDMAFLDECLRLGNPDNSIEYVKVIMGAAVKRYANYSGKKLLELSEKEDTNEIVEEAEQLLAGFGKANNTGNVKDNSIGAIMNRYKERNERLREVPFEQRFIRTGFYDIDNIITGLERKDTTIIAGATGMGKTRLLLAILKNILDAKKTTALFSYEMSEDQIINLLIEMVSMDLTLKELRELSFFGDSGKVDQYNWATDYISKLPLHIYGVLHSNVNKAKSVCRQLVAQNNLEVAAFDLMTQMYIPGKFSSRADEVSQLSRSLKMMVSELDIHGIATAHINREVAKAQDKRPQLNHLKESGGIENDASRVLLLYREGYYYPDSENPNIAEINIAKDRHSGGGTVQLYWHDGKFGNLQRKELL